jgi:hypothetical protein
MSDDFACTHDWNLIAVPHHGSFHGYCWNRRKRLYPYPELCGQNERGLRKAPEEVRCIQVKGKRLDTETRIRTRSRAAMQQEQYEAVPAPVQIFVLLADMLIEAREGALR